MQYVPLASGESSASDEEAGPSSICGCIPSSSEEDIEPPEWRDHIFSSAWWYRWSSFTYCVAGGMLVVRPAPMYRHAQPCCGGPHGFPFRTMGAFIFVNGLLSYMGDTYTWGHASCWKTADVLAATTNTLLQFALVLLHVLGPMSFPRDMVSVFTVSLVAAVVCKRRAALALQRRDRDAYLRWHTAWHVVLPAGAVIGQLLLEP